MRRNCRDSVPRSAEQRPNAAFAGVLESAADRRRGLRALAFLLVVPEKVSGDFFGRKYLIFGGTIQVNHKISVFTTKLDRFAGARPVDDATSAVVCVQIDSNFAGSGPPTTAATDLEVVNSR
jgi:hypothetical protein